MTDAIRFGQEQLLQRAKQGDLDAFEALYTLLVPDLSRYIGRIVNHEQDAADVVQETFIALYTHLHAVENWSHLRPYVFRIARNTAYDLLRQRGRVNEIGIAVDGDDVPTVGYAFHLSDDAPLPEESTHWLLMLIEVQNAIDLLPAPQREALMLFTEGDMTYAEIATVTGVSIGTVKSRIFHAKKTLRGLVRPEILLAMQESAPRGQIAHESQSESQTVELKDQPHATGNTTTDHTVSQSLESAAKIT